MGKKLLREVELEAFGAGKELWGTLLQASPSYNQGDRGPETLLPWQRCSSRRAALLPAARCSLRPRAHPLCGADPGGRFSGPLALLSCLPPSPLTASSTPTQILIQKRPCLRQ